MPNLHGQEVFLHSHPLDSQYNAFGILLKAVVVSERAFHNMVQVRIVDVPQGAPLPVQRLVNRVLGCEYSRRINFGHREPACVWPVNAPNSEAVDQFVNIIRSQPDDNKSH